MYFLFMHTYDDSELVARCREDFPLIDRVVSRPDPACPVNCDCGEPKCREYAFISDDLEDDEDPSYEWCGTHIMDENGVVVWRDGVPVDDEEPAPLIEE